MGFKNKSFTFFFLIAFANYVNLSLASHQSANLVITIAKQLSFGLKRNVYYLDHLIERCNSVQDVNDWIEFMNSYLRCDANAWPKRLNDLGNKGHSIERISLVCKHWALKKKCSFKLATKLNSCLNSHLEGGKAGTNGLRLAEAHTNFLCHHKIEYADNLNETFANVDSEYFIPAEKRPLNCYENVEQITNSCILEKERDTVLKTFCQKFQLAKECLQAAYRKSCNVEATNEFMENLFDEVEFQLEC